jgi:hypothetical protein
MITYHMNQQTGEFEVKGPVDEMKVGVVTVTLKSGGTKQVRIYELGGQYKNKWDDGKLYCFGYLKPRDAEPSSDEDVPF